MTSVSLPGLFSIYCVLAVGYNLGSVLLEVRTGKRAAPTDPQIGILFIAALYLVHSIGSMNPSWLNIFFLASLSMLTIRSGIFRHVFGYDEEQYFSRQTWAAAFMINIFGAIVILSIIGVSIIHLL